MTFSKIYFTERLDEQHIKDLFGFLTKNLNPIKTRIAYLPTKKRRGTFETRTTIKEYDKALTLTMLDELINTTNGRKKPFIPKWKEYRETIRAIA